MRAALLLSLFAASAAVSILDQDGFGVLSEDESGDELIIFDTDGSTKQLTVKQAADAAKVVRGVYSNEAWTAAQKDLDSTTLCPKANGATSPNAWVKLFAHLCIKKGTKPTHIENFKSAGMTVLSGIKAAILAALDKTGKAAIRQDKRHSNTYNWYNWVAANKKCIKVCVHIKSNAQGVTTPNEVRIKTAFLHDKNTRGQCQHGSDREIGPRRRRRPRAGNRKPQANAPQAANGTPSTNAPPPVNGAPQAKASVSANAAPKASASAPQSANVAPQAAAPPSSQTK